MDGAQCTVWGQGRVSSSKLGGELYRILSWSEQGQSMDVCQTDPGPDYDSGSMPVSIKGMSTR